MTATTAHKIPQTWDDARDVPFFRITARLFTPEFCLGASVLLVSYENDAADSVLVTPTRQAARTTAPTGDGHDTRPEHERVPVRVRRTG